MNVNMLMKTSLMKNAKIIAGHEGVLRDISWCVPDTSLLFDNWLMPGLLCIYTGKNEKYGWERCMEILVRHKPAAILLFGVSENILKDKFDYDFFNQEKLPLILMEKATNPLTFTKHMAVLLSTSFNNERRIEEWLRDLCCGYKDAYNDSLAELLGYVPKYKYTCIIAKMRKTEGKNPLSVESKLTYVKDLLTEFLAPASDPTPVLAFIEDTSLIYFAAFPLCDDGSKKAKSKISSAVLRVKEQTPDCKWRFSVGTPADSLSDFTESFLSAKQTANLIQNLNVHENVSFYEDWYMHMILLREPRHKLKRHMEQSLAPLLENEELIETLCDYLTFGENLKLTADHLYVHTNTLKYRISKISEALSCDLKDPNVRFRLRMAITIYRYLKNTE